jgi:hypothetical protein
MVVLFLAMEFLEITLYYTVLTVARDGFAKYKVVVANEDLDSFFLIHKMHYVACHIISMPVSVLWMRLTAGTEELLGLGEGFEVAHVIHPKLRDSIVV